MYARIASHDGLEWQTLEEVTRAVQSLLDPVLADVAGVWVAATCTWSAARQTEP